MGIHADDAMDIAYSEDWVTTYNEYWGIESSESFDEPCNVWITKGMTKKFIPYTMLTIDGIGENLIELNFVRYTRNTWVLYRDYRHLYNDTHCPLPPCQKWIQYPNDSMDLRQAILCFINFMQITVSDEEFHQLMINVNKVNFH
jgi:hypothetical protein